MEIGSFGLVYTIAALALSTIVPLAVLIWFIVSIQAIKKSLRSIDTKLSQPAGTGQIKVD